ncbi:MAG TPA: glycosyl hydrolase [Blastocatellia bacterium]|nr:glycosyl hydrolase [Blastocatellia bacterium]
MRQGALFLLLILLASLRIDAQTVSRSTPYDPALFRFLQWRNIGPDRAGRSIACAGSSARPFEYYSGAVGGGLWKTADGGATWKPVTDRQINSSSVGAVAVSESQPDIVYIGMGEVQIQRNMLQGDGVYKSTDAGKTWSHIGLADTQVISRVRVHPQNPNLIYVAAFGHPYGANEERGVYRSTDGGKSWQKILFRNNLSGAVDLVMDRLNPSILFAAIWEARVTATGAVLSGGPGSGLFKSTDGGDTWTELTRNPGLPKATIGKIGVSIAGSDSRRVYALIEAEDGGVFRSDDGGEIWAKVNDEGALRQRPSYFNRIYADPKEKDVVYVLNFFVYKSTDGGKSYRVVQNQHPDQHDLWIDANNTRRMIVSNDGGGTVTVNGGESWTAQAYPTAQLYRVATTRDIPYHVCGAQQDQGAICVPSSQSPWRSTSPYLGPGIPPLGGPVYAPGGGEFGMMAPHPRDPDLFFATGPSVITRFDRRTGLSQARDVQVSPVADRGPNRERFSLYSLAFSHHDPNTLYTSSQHVWRTTDGGLRWERISTDLSRPTSRDQNRPAGGSVSTLAPSYHEANTIWAGTDDGLVHVTRDGGKSWQEITPPGLPEFSRVNIIEASPHNPGAAYVAAKRHQLDDRAPYIFKTSDYGKSWKKIVAGIAPNNFVHVVREDPKRQGLLYAGTEHGVVVSFDDGENWQSLSLNMPDTQAPDLVVEANDIVIATHGRSFYILDNIGPLREFSPQVASSALHLFQPADAIRRLDQVVIDYALKADARRVVIEILDADGKVIRSYTNGDREPGGAQTGQSPEADESSDRQPERPSRSAGLNRFTWDLRYSSATVFPGMIMWVGSPNGPIAAPGSYQVRVTADGETRTRRFKILRDPRPSDLTDADIQEQFALALKIRDRISEANEGVILIRAVKKQISDRIDKAKDGQIASVGEAAIQRLSEVEQQLYQVKLRGELDAVTYPVMLNNRLANLKLSVETGDGRPTPQSYAAFQKLSSELDVQLGKLNDTMKNEVARFNILLGARK